MVILSGVDSKPGFLTNNVELSRMENGGKLNVPRGTIHVKKEYDVREVRSQ